MNLPQIRFLVSSPPGFPRCGRGIELSVNPRKALSSSTDKRTYGKPSSGFPLGLLNS
jgi:hypothetical protein